MLKEEGRRKKEEGRGKKAVGTRQCRVLYIIPVQPELILEGRRISFFYLQYRG
jgi:hypothetical protein